MLEHFRLFGLVSIRSFVTAQQFVALGHWKLLDLGEVAVDGAKEQVITVLSWGHVRSATFFEVESYVMKGALGEFQSAARAPQEIVPQLGIVLHELEHPLGGGLLCLFKVVGAIAGVVHEAQHVESDLDGAIRCEELGAMGSGGVAVEEGRGDKCPIHGGIAAALSCAVDGMSFAMLDERLGNPELGAEMVLGFSKCLSLDDAHFPVKTILLAAQVCQKAVDAVVAGGGIVVKFAEASPGGSGDFIFNFFAVNNIRAVTAWDASNLIWAQEIMIGGVQKCLAPFDA